MAKRFDGVYRQAVEQAGAHAKGEGMSPSQLQPRMRRAGLKYYAECELTMYTKKQRQLESSSDTGLGEHQSLVSCILKVLAAECCDICCTIVHCSYKDECHCI